MHALIKVKHHLVKHMNNIVNSVYLLMKHSYWTAQQGNSTRYDDFKNLQTS